MIKSQASVYIVLLHPQYFSIRFREPTNSRKTVETILTIMSSHLHSLSITREALQVTLLQRDGFKLLATHISTALETLTLSPIIPQARINVEEELTIPTLIRQSSTNIKHLDLGWLMPAEFKPASIFEN